MDSQKPPRTIDAFFNTARNHRLSRFKLQPGDEGLLEQVHENQRVLLLSAGTYQDKALRFGIPIGTVRSRIHRAKVALELLREEKVNKEIDPIN